MNSIDNYLILGKMYIRNRLEWYLERWVLRIFVIDKVDLDLDYS